MMYIVVCTKTNLKEYILSVIIGDVTYLTVSEVAKLIGRSSQTIKRWEDKGNIAPATRQKSNQWRIYSPKAVDEIKKYSESRDEPIVQADLLKG